MPTPRPPRTALPQLTDRLPLGPRGALRVSPACLGMVGSPRAVAAAFDEGVNFFFVTADMHWPLYEPLRRGLRQLLRRGPAVRDQIVVAAVSYVTQPEFTWMPFEEVLDAVPGLGRLDVLVIGGAYGPDFRARLETYRGRLADGLAGASALGATFHDRPAAVPAVNDELVDVAFVRYNADHPGAREDVFPHVARTRTLLYNFKSLARTVTADDCRRLGVPARFWYPRPTDYYRFALTRPELDGVLCAPQTPAEVRGLRDALREGPLAPHEEEHLIRLAALADGRMALRPATGGAQNDGG